MSLILKVWSNNPFNNGGCDFAVVELTPRLASLALRRITLFCDQKSLDPSAYETYYWGSEAEYFNPWTDQVAASEEKPSADSTDVADRLEQLQVNEREIVLTEEFTIPQSLIAAVECGQMIVRENGIAFTAIPKHNDFYVTTAEIPKDILSRFAGSA